jgi:hypothetical protein
MLLLLHPFDRVAHLQPMHWHMSRRINSDPHDIIPDADNRDPHVVANSDALIDLP